MGDDDGDDDDDVGEDGDETGSKRRIKEARVQSVESSSDDDATTTTTTKTSNVKRAKNTQVLLIDDVQDETHKPWITAELISLIKHRNMLQAKINEKASMSPMSTDAMTTTTTTTTTTTAASEADEELLKKFKNLRNKVTKLVKKARSTYPSS